MRTYILSTLLGVSLLVAACEKTSNYDQYYRVEYSNEGYHAVATMMQDDKLARPEVSLNGEKGVATDAGYVWDGKGQPDMKFSALLTGVMINNTVTYADAPVYDIYMPDTFSRSKGAWFVYNQSIPVAGENEQFWTGAHGSSPMLYTSDKTPNDTVWVSLKDGWGLNGDSAMFQFAVIRDMDLQKTDGKGKGRIDVWKVFKKWVKLVP